MSELVRTPTPLQPGDRAVGHREGEPEPINITLGSAAARNVGRDAEDVAPGIHDHTIDEILFLTDTINELTVRLQSAEQLASPGQFWPGMWTVVQGSAPGQLVFAFDGLPSSGDTITHIGILIDNVEYTVPLAQTFVFQHSTAADLVDVAIRAETLRTQGPWSLTKPVTTGVPTVPEPFDGDDWVASPGSGPEAVQFDLRSLPDSHLADITLVQIDIDGGTPIDIGGTTIGNYNVPAVGYSGEVDVRARASNSAGPGPWSSVQTITLPSSSTVPGKFASNGWGFTPDALPGTARANVISAPGDGGSDITGYQVDIDEGVPIALEDDADLGPRRLVGLPPDATVSGRIRAINANGPGLWSDPKEVDTLGGSYIEGGVSTVVGNFIRYTFIETEEIFVHGDPITVDWEVVGAGASGGTGRGGGGGAGRVRRSTDAGMAPRLLATGPHNVTVGLGGVAVTVSSQYGNPGQPSALDDIIANGGGAGSGGVGAVPGGTGGSGGGGRGGASGISSVGGPANGSMTNPGGAGSTDANTANQHGGGGGGALTAGAAATISSGGAGGNGTPSIAPGLEDDIYAGGGGGATNRMNLIGGLGGDNDTTGGRGASGTLATGNPGPAQAGKTPGSGGGGGPQSGTGGLLTSGAGFRGQVNLWHRLPGPVIVPADIIVSTNAAILTAMAAVTSNLNRTYIIELAAGQYGNLEIPSSYNKGTTRVQLRGPRGHTARIRTIRARSSRNLEFIGLDVTNNARDRFGFPDNSGAGIDLRDSRNITIMHCLIEHHHLGVDLTNARQIRFLRNRETGIGMDCIRMLVSNDTNVAQDIEIGWNYFNHRSDRYTFGNNFSNQAAFMGYAIPPNLAIDTRRSDQRNGDVTIRDLNNVAVLVRDDYNSGGKQTRHPDILQGLRTAQNLWIHDNIMDSGDYYVQSFFWQTWSDYNGGVIRAPYSTNVLFDKNWITSAHVLGIYLRAFTNPVVRNTLIRRYPNPQWDSGNTPRTYPGIGNKSVDEGQVGDSLVQVENCVFPSTRNTTEFLLTKCNAITPLVFSDNATPSGWSGFDVANNRVGPYSDEITA